MINTMILDSSQYKNIISPYNFNMYTFWIVNFLHYVYLFYIDCCLYCLKSINNDII